MYSAEGDMIYTDNWQSIFNKRQEIDYIFIDVPTNAIG